MLYRLSYAHHVAATGSVGPTPVLPSPIFSCQVLRARQESNLRPAA